MFEMITGQRYSNAVVALLVEAVLLSAAAQVHAPPTTREIITDLRSHQYDRALELLQAAILRSPNDTRLWTLKGVALAAQGHAVEALKSFHHALKSSPDDLAALEGAARIDYEMRAPEAVEDLQHIVRLDPHSAPAHAMLGELAFERRDCDVAAAEFAQAGSALATTADALGHYGGCLLKLKDNETASEVFEQQLNLQPDNLDARMRLAALQLELGHSEDTLNTLKPVLSENADSAVFALAAAAYEKDNHTPEAVDLLRRAILRDPTNEDLYLQFADISFTHQSFQVGVDMIDAGLRARPDAVVLLVARGILLVQLSRFDEAEADFEKASRFQPDSPLVGIAQGVLAQQTKGANTALQVIREKLKAKPRDPNLLYLQAESLLEGGSDAGQSQAFDDAEQSARAALAIKPDMAEAYDLLATIELQKGNNEKAVEESRSALRYNPADQSAVYRLITTLHKLGRDQEMPVLLKRLLQLRADAKRQDAEHNRFNLVEAGSPNPVNAGP